MSFSKGAAAFDRDEACSTGIRLAFWGVVEVVVLRGLNCVGTSSSKIKVQRRGPVRGDEAMGLGRLPRLRLEGSAWKGLTRVAWFLYVGGL